MSMGHVLCTAALLLDCALMSLAIRPAYSGPLLILALAHAADCIVFTLGLWTLLPAPLRRQRWKFSCWTSTVAYLVPVLGMAGILLLVTPALIHCRQPRMPRDRTAMSEDAADAGLDGASAHAGTPGRDLAGILRHAGTPAARATALIHTLVLEDESALPLLRTALRDRDDDIRLLSYSLLSRKEKYLEQRIEQHHAALRKAGTGQSFHLHRALAYDFWELSYRSAPVPGQSSPFAIQAGEHVSAALALRPNDAGLWLLHGRILLQALLVDSACAAFEKAARLGLERQAAPFLDEIAFRRRRLRLASSDARHMTHDLQAHSSIHNLSAGISA